MRKLIILFLFPIILHAQNNKGFVTYNYFAYDKNHVAKLYFKPGFSLYKLNLEKSNKKIDVKVDDAENKIIVSVNHDKDVPDNLGLLTNLKSKEIIEQQYIAKNLSIKSFDTLFVKENTNFLKWEITEETKKIDRFLCQKATASFRGRVFNAWFTSEVPISFGPWKLNGLPGLILEAYDTEKKFIFSAEKIEFIDDIEINEIDFLHKKYITPIDYRVMVFSVMDKSFREITAQIQSKLPRSTGPIKRKTNGQKTTSEQDFIEINFDDLVKTKN